MNALDRIPEVTQEQLRLLERAASNLAAACEVIAPMLGTDWLSLMKAANRHGMRTVLRAAKLLP